MISQATQLADTIETQIIDWASMYASRNKASLAVWKDRNTLVHRLKRAHKAALPLRIKILMETWLDIQKD